MTDFYFRPASDGSFDPEPVAHSPWADDMLHGRLLGGLAARALEQSYGGDGWRAARLTVDLFRPSAMKPVEITVQTVRQGRSLRVADALASCDGHQVGRATAVFLPEREEPPGRIWRPEPPAFPDPETVPAPDDPTADEDGWLFRQVSGGFGTGERSSVWTNDTLDLVEGEPMSPFVRASVSGDIACPLANSSDEGLHYINADYTMLLARYPEGAWIGVEVDMQLQADGISVASATLLDQRGPFATSGGTSVARPPLPNDTEPVDNDSDGNDRDGNRA